MTRFEKWLKIWNDESSAEFVELHIERQQATLSYLLKSDGHKDPAAVRWLMSFVRSHHLHAEKELPRYALNLLILHMFYRELADPTDPGSALEYRFQETARQDPEFMEDLILFLCDHLTIEDSALKERVRLFLVQIEAYQTEEDDTIWFFRLCLDFEHEKRLLKNPAPTDENIERFTRIALGSTIENPKLGHLHEAAGKLDPRSFAALAAVRMHLMRQQSPYFRSFDDSSHQLVNREFPPVGK